ncbi:hypothetical protein Daesc_001762 [Daldinia eschscholtzii]|uniref:Uncharacterized protein n=1 Tax=Daldinia eschscholtzii TaxID=292717 RepID=A0AAX6MVF7_9PEZI
MARFANVIDPVTEDFEGSTMAYMVDAISISIGSLLGCPPVTAFVESGAGIADGGRTGLTSMTTGLIADGLIGGICLYITLNTLVWLIEKISGGRIVPPNKAEKDRWTWRLRGGILPPWVMRLYTGKSDFLQDDTPVTESSVDVPGNEEVVKTKSKESGRGHTEASTLRVQEKST